MRRILLGGAILLLAVVFTAFAQPAPGCCGQKAGEMGAGCKGGEGCEMGAACEGCGPMGMEMKHERMMMGGRGMMMRDGNPETIRGRVVSVERGPRDGMKVMVESDSRMTPVMIGPESPAEIRENLEKNDRVEISGMRVMRGGRSMLVAREISVDDEQVITLKRPERPGRPDRPQRMERMEMRKRMHPRAY